MQIKSEMCIDTHSLFLGSVMAAEEHHFILVECAFKCLWFLHIIFLQINIMEAEGYVEEIEEYSRVVNQTFTREEKFYEFDNKCVPCRKIYYFHFKI